MDKREAVARAICAEGCHCDPGECELWPDQMVRAIAAVAACEAWDRERLTLGTSLVEPAAPIDGPSWELSEEARRDIELMDEAARG